VIIYRAATLPIEAPRVRRVALQELPQTALTAEETVVLPPAYALRENHEMQARLAELDALDRAARVG
jgi:hypothetical protein